MEFSRTAAASGWVERGSWKLSILDSGITAVIACPMCGGESSLAGREIDAGGLSLGAFECPYLDCHFEVSEVRLVGWGAAPAGTTAQRGPRGECP